MRRLLFSSIVALGALVTLGACTTATVVPTPSASSTPPPVERTVAAGTTQQFGPEPAAPSTSPSRNSMQGMQGMPGMPGMSTGSPSNSVVPNGKGPHEVAAQNADGCNRVYGSPAQCVPLHAPGGGPLTCSVLKQYHYLPLLVTKDPLGLLTRAGATVHARNGKRYLTGCTS